MRGKWNILKASQQISTTTEQLNLHVSRGWCPERFERDQLRSAQRKWGIGFVWNPNVSAVYLLCLVLFVRAVLSASSLSVCPRVLLSIIWNVWTSDLLLILSVTIPAWVWTTPMWTACLLHLRVCVWERVVLIALCMWTSLSEKTLMNCVFLCACQWPRGTAGPRNYLNGRSCISTAAGWFKGWRAG